MISFSSVTLSIAMENLLHDLESSIPQSSPKRKRRSKSYSSSPVSQINNPVSSDLKKLLTIDKIKKLTSSNTFHTWHRDICTFLQINGLHKYVKSKILNDFNNQVILTQGCQKSRIPL